VPIKIKKKKGKGKGKERVKFIQKNIYISTEKF
jgi:hypothetical protein